MANEQGPKGGEAPLVPEVLESMRSSRLPGFRRPSGSTAVKTLMDKGTVASEIRSEMRRAMGICKAIGLRLERALDHSRAGNEMPDESFLPRTVQYATILQRLVDCQVKLEKEARLRYQGLTPEQRNEKLRALMEDQILHIVNESRRGSRAREKTKVGA